MVKGHRTSSFPAPSRVAERAAGRLSLEAYREILDLVPSPSVVLDEHGFVVECNRAFADLLQAREPTLIGEPLLAWIHSTAETGAFGRAFQGLRSRPPGHDFLLELTLTSAVGPIACGVQGRKLSSGHVLVTCASAEVREPSPERDMGNAIKRSLEALDQGMLLLDGHGQIVHANPAARVLIGGRPVGRNFLELIPPARVDDVTRAMTVASAGTWHDELDLSTVDGEIVPVELSLAAGRGHNAPAVALFRDLRDRRQRQFEVQLAALIDRQLLSSPRPRETIPAACRTLIDTLGIEQVSVIARVADGWERWSVHPDRSPRIGPVPASGPPAAWSEVHGVFQANLDDPQVVALFGVDGEIVTQRGLRTALQVALPASSGVVGHMLVIGRIGTVEAARAPTLLGKLAPQFGLSLANGLLLAETEAFAAYQSMLLDQTTVMLNSLDGQGRVVSWNRASERLLGIPADEARGRVFGLDVAPSADPDRWRELWQELVETGAIASELVVRDRDGKAIPLHIEGRLLRDVAGAAAGGAVLVGLDLRHRRALEEQILKSQKLAAVGLLAAGIAHEINNPLSGVVGYSKLLLDKPLPPEVRARVEKIAVSGERCQKIVEGVLLFSRQQEGQDRRPVDIRAIIDRVVAIGEYQWRMHNVQILRDVGDTPEIVEADGDQLEQVLLNLLSNAVDAMPRGGTVRIKLARLPDRRLQLDVADEGHGIPEEILAHIFDPFFSTKEIGKGTGLGLAISYGIIKDHGGDILVNSRPNEGTTFSVVLPAEGPNRSPTPTQRGV